MTLKEEQKELRKAVREFGGLMKNKLIEKADRGWRDWDNPEFQEKIEQDLLFHVMQLIKGDRRQAVDVANLAMFLCVQHDKAEKLIYGDAQSPEGEG